MEVTLLGDQKLSMPVGISPTAFQKMAHPEREIAVAKAAQAAGTLRTLSSFRKRLPQRRPACSTGGTSLVPAARVQGQGVHQEPRGTCRQVRLPRPYAHRRYAPSHSSLGN
ncbi:unnamed protein product [Ixodes pacificus]